MKQKGFISYIIQFVLLCLLQIIIIKQDFVLFNGYGFCFAYVMFLLSLPVSLPRSATLTIAFICGLFIDLFYNSPGINAATCVLLMFLRPYILPFLNTQGFSESITTISINSVGIRVYIVYIFTFIFIHHLGLFILQEANFDRFWIIISKTIISTIYTSLVILIIQYIFYTERRAR